MKESSLILEGGGMRGMYTSGVLDAFMDSDLYIDNIYAVSAGCYNALSYISRQKGRTYRMNITYLRDKRYINMMRLITTGSAINNDFIFEEVFKNLDKFDYEAFKNNCKKLCVVCTDCETGEAFYPLVKDLEKDADYIKASTALPLFTNMVHIDGRKYTDGGVSDSFPIEKAIEDGHVNNVIILTQPKGFKLGDNSLTKFYKVRYRKYPNLIKTMLERKEKYNKTLEYIEKLEEEGKAIVIRPKESLNISNLEKNEDKIRKIYEMGYVDGMEYVSKIMKFIKVNKNVKR